jgi:drug/metabolite transporter (DMT)-like permease
MTVIVFSSPIVTTIIAHFLLNERCGIVFIGIALFTLVGVALITKPPVLTGEQDFDSNTLVRYA